MELDPKNFAELLDKIEAEADEFLLARNQMVENDKERNVNREALTALRKRARFYDEGYPWELNQTFGPGSLFDLWIP